MIQDLVLRLKGAVDSAAQAMPGLLSRVASGALNAVRTLSALRLAFLAQAAVAGSLASIVQDAAGAFQSFVAATAIARRVALLTAAFVGLSAAMIGAADAATHYVVEQRRMAEGLGVSLQTMQRLSIATAAYGLDAEGLTNVLGTLADRAQQVREGNEGATADFKSMGVSVADLRGKNPAELFRVLAQRIKETGPTTASTSAAFRILGGDAAKLLPLLRRGTQEIDKIGDAAERMGVLIGREAAHAAEEYGVEVEELRVQMRALGAVLAITAVPAARRLVAEFRDFVRLYAPTVIEAARKATEGLTFAIENLLGPMRDLARLLLLGSIAQGARSIGVMALAAARAVPFLVRLRGAVVYLRVAITTLASTLGAAVLPIIGLGLAVDDLLAFMNGGPSIIGDMVQALRDLGAWLMQQEGVPELLQALQDVSAVMAYLGGVAVGGLIGALSSLFKVLRPIWMMLAQIAGFTFKNLGNAVSAGARAAGGALGAVGNAVAGTGANNLGGVLAAAQRGVAVGKQGIGAVRQDIAINVTGVTGDQVAQQIARQLDTTFAAAASAGG